MFPNPDARTAGRRPHAPDASVDRGVSL